MVVELPYSTLVAVLCEVRTTRSAASSRGRDQHPPLGVRPLSRRPLAFYREAPFLFASFFLPPILHRQLSPPEKGAGTSQSYFDSIPRFAGPSISPSCSLFYQRLVLSVALLCTVASSISENYSLPGSLGHLGSIKLDPAAGCSIAAATSRTNASQVIVQTCQSKGEKDSSRICRCRCRRCCLLHAQSRDVKFV